MLVCGCATTNKNKNEKQTQKKHTHPTRPYVPIWYWDQTCQIPLAASDPLAACAFAACRLAVCRVNVRTRKCANATQEETKPHPYLLLAIEHETSKLSIRKTTTFCITYGRYYSNYHITLIIKKTTKTKTKQYHITHHHPFKYPHHHPSF